MALQRLFKELKFIKANPVYGCTADQDGDDPFRWKATLQGPKGSLYEGGTWHLDISFPHDYPFHPPNLTFKTPIFHPNIGGDGYTCVDVLGGQWSPEMNINKVLLSLCSLLCEPNPDSHTHDAAQLYKNNREAYDNEVKQMTQQFAMGTATTVAMDDLIGRVASVLRREDAPAAQNSSIIAVRVSMFDGKKVTVRVEKTAGVFELKQKIGEINGVDGGLIRVLFKGRQLESTQKLSDPVIDMKDGDEVQVVFRVKGGI